MNTRPGSALDFATLREFFRQGMDTVQVQRATVGWDGESSPAHVELNPGADVALHVTTAEGYPITARLMAVGGLWRVPDIGEEVLVAAPEGSWSQGVGVAVVFVGLRPTPQHLTATQAVLALPADGLLVGDGATKAAARTDDPITPGTLAFAASGANLTVTYTPPGGTPTVVTIGLSGAVFVSLPATTITLGGKVGAGSSKVRIE